MKEVKDYVIRQETMLLLPRFDQFGNLSTLIVESNAKYHIAVKPKVLVDHCLGYYGSSLRGASDGAKKILGNIHMCPIIMSEVLSLYWFSTKSPDQEDCIWFALHHIQEYEGTDVKETRVTLSNGVKVTIELSLYRFKEKVQRAYQLKGKLEERSKRQMFTAKEQMLLYSIRKPNGILNYEVKKEPKDE